VSNSAANDWPILVAASVSVRIAAFPASSDFYVLPLVRGPKQNLLSEGERKRPSRTSRRARTRHFVDFAATAAPLCCAGLAPPCGTPLVGRVEGGPRLALENRRPYDPIALARRPLSATLDHGNREGNRNRRRAADDFATIRARMEELRREREAALATQSEADRIHQCVPAGSRSGRSERSPRGKDGSDNNRCHKKSRSGPIFLV